MGAAGGHMPHPFDLSRVKDGDDLVDFFKDAIKSVENNKASLKLDGINTSFKLVDGPRGKEFAGDRGSLSPLDIGGITVGKVSRRFEEGHGMIEAYTNLLNIFNEALPHIDSELKMLGMYDNPTIFFNTEYVNGQTNVLDYDHDFLAIHNLMQIYEKTSKKGHRPGIPRPLDDDGKPIKGFATEIILDKGQQKALKSLINKVKKIAKNHNFKVYGSVPAFFKEAASADLERPLSKNFTIVYDKEFNDTQTAPLQDWLNQAKNPIHKSVVLADGRKIGALSKEVYNAILNGESLSHFLSVPEGVDSAQNAKNAIDGAVFYHATRMLGKEVNEALTSDMGDVANHEGVVIRDKNLYGVDMVKITGDFILGGTASPFSKKEETDFVCKQIIALVPGAYKPPHKEHLNMVKHYTRKADKVYVFVSPRSRGEEKNEQMHVTPEMSNKIWQLYIEAAGLSNVILSTTERNSPVQTSIDWIADNHKKGDCIILGASTKPDERGVPDVKGRFDRGGIEDYLSQEYGITNSVVEILDPLDPKFVYTFSADMSATNFRKALKQRSYEEIRNFLPDEVDEGQVLAILGIPPEPELELEPESEEIFETKKKETLSSILYGLVDEVLNERDYQKESERITDYLDDWRELHSSGPQDPGSAYSEQRPKKRSKSGPPAFAAEEVDDDEEIIEEEDIEETNAIEFVAGKKSYEQACHEDPNCRELQAKKKKIKISISHPPSEELEEISAMGAGAVEGGAGSPWINLRTKKKKRKQNEELVNEVINYLLKDAGA